MDHIRDALLRMVKSGRKARKVSGTFEKMGFVEGPLIDVYSGIMDSIYKLIGENCDEYCDSLTYKLVDSDNDLTDEEVAALLHDEYKRNFIDKLGPISREEFAEKVRKNGGYLCPTPEGDWT